MYDERRRKSEMDTAKRIGFETGRKEGFEEGREEGRELGHSEARIEIARKLKMSGIDVGIIVQTTGLNERDVEQL